MGNGNGRFFDKEEDIVTDHEHAVQVVDVAVLEAAVVETVLGHRHFGPVEHGRLVHVVPRVHVQRRSFVPGHRRWQRHRQSNHN